MGKVRAGDILDSFGYLQQLANATGLHGSHYKILKPVFRTCEQEAQDLRDAQNKVIRELTGGKETIKVDDPKWPEYVAQIEELRSGEVNIPNVPVKLPETIFGMSAVAIMALEDKGFIVVL